MSNGTTELQDVLEEYVNTANDERAVRDGAVDWDYVNSFFKDDLENGVLKDIDPRTLFEYVQTYNDPNSGNDFSFVNKFFQDDIFSNDRTFNSVDEKGTRNRKKKNPFDLGVNDFYKYPNDDKVYFEHDGVEYEYNEHGGVIKDTIDNIYDSVEITDDDVWEGEKGTLEHKAWVDKKQRQMYAMHYNQPKYDYPLKKDGSIDQKKFDKDPERYLIPETNDPYGLKHMDPINYFIHDGNKIKVNIR